MDLERKRSKGPEELGTKKQKLHSSPLSEQEEISIHASGDDEFLSSPSPTAGSDTGLPSPNDDSPALDHRAITSDSEAFPLVKSGKGPGEKRKVRRYRGVIEEVERHLEKEPRERRERSKREKRSASKERLKVNRSLSGRSSPQYREGERVRREGHERERFVPRERFLKRREDNRRGSFPYEREERFLHPRGDFFEGRRFDDGRELPPPPMRRRDERERLPREDRFGGFSRSPRRLERPVVREGQRERDIGREMAERRERGEREREKHHHKRGKHQREEGKERRKKHSEHDSDVSPHHKHLEPDKIEDLIKELEEDIGSSSVSDISDEEIEKSGGESGKSESESDHEDSDVSDAEFKEEASPRLTKDDSEPGEDLVEDHSPAIPDLKRAETDPVVKSKFDDDDVSDSGDDEVERPVRRGYSGYEALAASDASEEEEGMEESEIKEESQVQEVQVRIIEPERSPTPELPCYYPALMGCRNVENYEWLNRIEEGTYGVVYRARDKYSGEVVALKKLKMEKEKEGFPITSLREVNMLLKAKHPNIVHVREIVVGSSMDKIYIVMDYVEHDLKALMETMKQPFLEGEVKTLMVQLLRAVHHLHDNWILHRDLKASNLLLSHKGILKVGDFGLAREYGSPLKPYTPVVVTLWYRAPELLLGTKEYSTAIDLWSVGCIFAEFLLHKPLFRGKSEIDQLNQIFKELGTPSEKIWSGYNDLPVVQKVTFTKQPYNNLRKRFPYLTSNGFDLLMGLLTYDPKKRITAEQALDHSYFKESPLPVDPSMFPTWPARSELGAKRQRERSPQPPEGGAFNLIDDDGEGGFRLTQAQHGQASVGAGFSLKF